MEFIKTRLIEEISCVKVYHEKTNTQIYDLSLMTQGYYRIIIHADMTSGNVNVRSNIKEINERQLFEIETKNEALAAILSQADFLFANFIFMDLFLKGKEVLITTQYLEIEHYVNRMSSIKEKYYNQYNICYKDQSQAFELLMEQLDEPSKFEFEVEMAHYSKMIDDIFVESIFEQERIYS